MSKHETCPHQQAKTGQQTLPDSLTGRARDFDSRSAGSNPAPATMEWTDMAAPNLSRSSAEDAPHF